MPPVVRPPRRPPANKKHDTPANRVPSNLGSAIYGGPRSSVGSGSRPVGGGTSRKPPAWVRRVYRDGAWLTERS
jgi:hypothetical protein